MSFPGAFGRSYEEALLGLSEQVSEIYRHTISDRFFVSACLFQGGTLIKVMAQCEVTGEDAWVPLEIGDEAWTDERREQVVRDARRVIDDRLALDREAGEEVRAKIKEVIRGYH